MSIEQHDKVTDLANLERNNRAIDYANDTDMVYDKLDNEEYKKTSKSQELFDQVVNNNQCSIVNGIDVVIDKTESNLEDPSLITT